MATLSASASVSANVDDSCDDHVCASGAGCVVVDSETQYMCNCTAISTAAVRRVGRYCNTTVGGQPVSVGDGSANCPGCASLFVTEEGFDGNDPDAYLQSIIPLLAAAYCGCSNPPQALLNQFGAVQLQVQADGSLTVEFTIYSGNLDATAADIVGVLKDDPPTDLVVRTKRPKSSSLHARTMRMAALTSTSTVTATQWSSPSSAPLPRASSSHSAAAFVWYCLNKRVNQQFQARGNQVAVDAQEDVTEHVKPRTSTAWKEQQRSRSILPPSPSSPLLQSTACSVRPCFYYLLGYVLAGLPVII
jgi:hypothetical protein